MKPDSHQQEKPWVAPPDLVTGARIPLALAFLVVPSMWARLSFLVLFVASDVTDGMVARRFGGSRIGAVLDPVCDKLFMLTAFIVVLLSGVLSIWEILAVLLRDIVAAAGLIGVSVMGRATALPARAGGKAVTVGQILTLIAFVAGSDLTGSLAWATGAISIYAIWDYRVVYNRERAESVNDNSSQ